MAKMFYTAAEAAEKLGKTEDQLKALVRNGELREFRDAGTVNYKVEDIEKIVGEAAPATEENAEPIEEPLEIQLAPADEDEGSPSASDILLEPADESAIDLASLGGSDVVSLEDTSGTGTMGGTHGGTTAAGKTKGGTVVPSVGVNVFDDEELDEHVDPLAQTAVTDVAGLGIDPASSGSGILDLTRESDDTSLGQELLDEIYTDEGGSGSGVEVPAEAAEGTRVDLDGDVEAEGEAVVDAVDETPSPARVAVPAPVAAVADAMSASLTALLVVAVAVMCFAGLGAAGLVRGITPALIGAIYANLWMYAAGAAGVAVVAAVLTFFLGKRSR